MFLLAVSLSASWQLAFGPYVADYSRYLPRSTSARATFWWTLSGSALGSQWSMTRSACWSRRPAAARSSTTRSGTLVSLGGAGPRRVLLLLRDRAGQAHINVLKTYGGFMSMVTGISGFRGQRAPVAARPGRLHRDHHGRRHGVALLGK
ncbi:hypothetical protein [Streptomyces sp. KL116D]|uniref:hypothetical protein n=1 Tax=Streptomyces sp. KL116D TaxID=3045152 RepID=UPI0035572033